MGTIDKKKNCFKSWVQGKVFLVLHWIDYIKMEILSFEIILPFPKGKEIRFRRAKSEPSELTQ